MVRKAALRGSPFSITYLWPTCIAKNKYGIKVISEACALGLFENF
jgi:hypothetical protein